MLLSFIALLLSLLRVGKFMWNPVYFRTTAVSLMWSMIGAEAEPDLSRFHPPRHSIGSAFRFTSQLIGSLCAILAEIFALILWVTARHRYNDSDSPGRAKYGAALWLGLSGAIVAFIRFVPGESPRGS